MLDILMCEYNFAMVCDYARDSFVQLTNMGIQWFQALVFLAGLSIPVAVLVFAAADTARSEKDQRGKRE